MFWIDERKTTKKMKMKKMKKKKKKTHTNSNDSNKFGWADVPMLYSVQILTSYTNNNNNNNNIGARLNVRYMLSRGMSV